jgi:hypothetical protein
LVLSGILLPVFTVMDPPPAAFSAGAPGPRQNARYMRGDYRSPIGRLTAPRRGPVVGPKIKEMSKIYLFCDSCAWDPSLG